MRYNPDNPAPEHEDLRDRYNPDALLAFGGALARLRYNRGWAECWGAVLHWVAETAETAKHEKNEKDERLAAWLEDPAGGGGLVQRWAGELLERARDLLAPATDWAHGDRATPPPGANPEALADGYPVEVALVLGGLTADTRKQVRERLLEPRPADASTARERWARLAVAYRWLGVDPEPGGYVERPETYEAEPPPGSPEWIPGVWWRDTDDRPRFLRALVRDLWLGRWKDEAARARKKPAALVVPVYRDLLAWTGRRPSLPPGQLQLPGLVPVAREGAAALRECLDLAADVSPVLAQRIVRALVRWGAVVHTAGPGVRVSLQPGVTGQRTAGGAVELWVEGGLDGLRAAVGSVSKKDAPRDILVILAGCTVAWATGTARGQSALISWREDKAAPGRAAILRVTLGEVLLPGLASARDLLDADRVLVPVLPPPVLPSHSSRVGPALALDWALVGAYGERRDELREHGAVALDPVVVGRNAGVREAVVRECWNLWLGPDGRWTTPAPGRVRLVDRGPEGLANELLEAGADRTARASAAGRRGAAKRWREPGR